MFEILFIIALAAWLFFSAMEFVLTLPFAPTLIAAVILVPLLAVVRWRALVRAHRLSRLHPTTRPVPPERFYWPAQRHRIGKRLAVAFLLSFLLWPVACLCPAGATADWPSFIGWTSGLFAVLATAEMLAAGSLYLRASHWFDRHAPRFVGWIRRGLYRLSDNHEFLGEEPFPVERRRREKVY
ncbi:MAG: hypothetical protein ACO3YO_03395 [Chthoniobacterales bacterium]